MSEAEKEMNRLTGSKPEPHGALARYRSAEAKAQLADIDAKVAEARQKENERAEREDTKTREKEKRTAEKQFLSSERDKELTRPHGLRERLKGIAGGNQAAKANLDVKFFRYAGKKLEAANKRGLGVGQFKQGGALRAALEEATRPEGTHAAATYKVPRTAKLVVRNSYGVFLADFKRDPEYQVQRRTIESFRRNGFYSESQAGVEEDALLMTWKYAQQTAFRGVEEQRIRARLRA